MKIAVIGSGAIGGLVAGYLKSKNLEVSLTGHPDAVKAIKEKGLTISGARGNFNLSIEINDKLLAKPDLAIICTKTQDIESVFQENLPFLSDTLILTTQNGVAADNLVARFVAKENIISSIVMFGATLLEPGKITHNFEGSWIIGRMFGKNDARTIETAALLNQAFPTIVAEDLSGMKYLKIFVNANNCIAAILGRSMQESFSDINISRISIAIWKEGLEVLRKAGINLVSLPDFPLERLQKLAALPGEEAAKIFSGIMSNLSKEPLYGSILQSIKRAKASEIDYINGEFVKIAKENQIDAPLNAKLVEMVHQVEQSKKFFSKEQLLSSTKGLFN
ncbi:MAG: ketopantoate reductase family protein [Candidatus Omnitrophica bacterium]|nr:ketopantoate reductase family protein [Candidatus Omnitrophota bacterium]